MPNYKVPQRDMRFLMNEVFDFPAHYQQLSTGGEATPDMVDAIISEMGKLCENTLAPLYQSGDKEGCKLEDGKVTTPTGFKEAYDEYMAGGWQGLSHPVEYGGQGLPMSLGLIKQELMGTANWPFAMYPGLSLGAMNTIMMHGTDEQKDQYLKPLTEGVWGGTMCLTEPQCGTDLGQMKTKAEPDGNGGYKITGTKIFISSGDHGLTENVVHIVLARLPDAPPGTKGISLFIVPKYLPGKIGEDNGVVCGSLEEKMGIKASATCVMNFDGAKGWLVGEPNKGLAAMFTMMNYERLGVGIQGVGAAEASLQSAREYALERTQSRAPTGAQQPEKAADPILVHPDVRRMLLTMKGYVEGGRAFSTYVAQWLDISKYSDDDERRKHAEGMVALLTPVAKAFLTDRGLDACIMGQQVFGGHGFIREWGQEQLVRDCRITQIYEGTNGIQALDLMGRKVVGSQGKLYELFAEDVAAFIEENSGDENLRPYLEPLAAAFERLSDVTEHVIKQAGENPDAVGAASVDYLDLFGLTALGYMWAKMVKAAAPKAEGDTSGFYTGKVKSARFYFDRLLPKTVALAEGIRSGSGSMMALTADEF